jgi:uridine phosphorylase
MAKRIAETDLILQKDGSVYHLNLLPHHIADTVIAVGDPNRVYQVSRHFDDVEFEINQREFITHVGNYKGKKLTVISTGIGTDNIEICLTEIDALVNVDLKTREVKPTKKSLNIIRIGTSGALQEDIPVGTHLVTDFAVGFDNLMQFYSLPQSEFELMIATDLKNQTEIDFLPYVVKCSELLQSKIGFDMVVGNTVTAPGFYAPQGRELRIPIRYPKLLEQLNYYHNRTYNFWLTNFEMESAGYYAMGRLLGHEMLSVNAILANRITNEFASHPTKITDALINNVLERVVLLK